MLKHWSVGLLCVALAACGGSDDDGDSTGGTSGAGGEHEHAEGKCAATGLDFASGDAAAGEEIYSGYCASCHGADGMGLPDAPAAGSRGADLHEHVNAAMSDDCWVDVIKNGEGVMAGIPGITDQQLVDVIAYMNASFTH
jgi:mono/diheme cytochrome c family protein